jgi:hypothetical protein
MVSAPSTTSAAPSANVPEAVSLTPLSEQRASDEPPTVSVMDLPSVPLRPAIVPVAVPAAGGSVAGAAKVDPDGIVVVAPAPAASKSNSAAARPSNSIDSVNPYGPVKSISGWPKDVAHAGTPTIRTDLANCSPPFYFDELGLKIFKPECVN